MAYNYKQGYFKPMNPQKYKGNPNNIVYRSGLELKAFLFLDRHPDIIQYSSEEVRVPYRDPTNGRARTYYPDLYIKRADPEGNVHEFLVEIKPLAQTKPPPLTSKGIVSKRHMHQAITYAINRSKWSAAEAYCAQRGWKFIIITEKDLPK